MMKRRWWMVLLAVVVPLGAVGLFVLIFPLFFAFEGWILDRQIEARKEMLGNQPVEYFDDFVDAALPYLLSEDSGWIVFADDFGLNPIPDEFAFLAARRLSIRQGRVTATFEKVSDTAAELHVEREGEAGILVSGTFGKSSERSFERIDFYRTTRSLGRADAAAIE